MFRSLWGGTRLLNPEFVPGSALSARALLAFCAAFAVV